MPKRAMPKFTPAPAELVERFSSALSRLPDVESRKMFGYPAAFAGGNMFAGIFRNSIVLRLPDEERAELVRLGATPFEPMPGRVMREYVVVPASLSARTSEFASWLTKARDFARQLPKKNATRRKGRK